ncbi:SGNH/GDSL hydrolase family protein [Lachnotalea sp. AF33-28]|jgi:lysophospholipase L1-like esterase|uniref:SGNH/GDSL hydrolase family protein n=1 Tax=Lachnotalea sp. AF33-28 TaxID=2292046 RepID=UPI000E51EBF6|nr:SGNH/GDSL hydrolase family protein [Lachnotalea sp. AF33-28]RHP34933.1 hypothetical protein DWZ56_05320 [Lachnotalea sp. AF33-28]
MKTYIHKRGPALLAMLLTAALLLSGCSFRANQEQTSEPTETQKELQTSEANTTQEQTAEPATEETTEETTEEATTEEPTEETTEKETFAPVDIKTVEETVWATTSVNVREFWSAKADKVGGLAKGQKVTRTGICDNGWSQVSYKGKEAYVNSKYLTTEEPVPETTTIAETNAPNPGGDPGNGEQAPPPEQPTSPPSPSNAGNGKKWCSFGDSITAQGGWQDTVTNYFGFSGFDNAGKAGAYLADDGSDKWLGARIQTIPTDANVITIFAGVNDLIFDHAIGEITDTSTVKGGLSHIIDEVRKRVPGAQIIVVTPYNTYDSGNTLGLTLNSYADAIKEVASAQSVPVIDLYYGSDFSPSNQADYTVDRIHLNSAGKAHLGDVMVEFLKSIL